MDTLKRLLMVVAMVAPAADVMAKQPNAAEKMGLYNGGKCVQALSKERAKQNKAENRLMLRYAHVGERAFDRYYHEGREDFASELRRANNPKVLREQVIRTSCDNLGIR